MLLPSRGSVFQAQGTERDRESRGAMEGVMATCPCRELLELSENHTLLDVPREGLAGQAVRAVWPVFRAVASPGVKDAGARGE